MADHMTLVERLRGVARYLVNRDQVEMADTVRAAIARIEAADTLDGELPASVLLLPVSASQRDTRDAVLAYRALVREQDGGK